MPTTGDEKKMMKISELEQRTGIPRETIHYYIREGLLPAPMKKGLRLAYYDESYIGLIDLIKKLQEERYLPLSVIKNLFLEEKYDVAELEKAFISDLFGKTSALRRYGSDHEDRKQRDVTLPKDYLKKLAGCGLVSLEPGNGKPAREPSALDARLAQLCLRGEHLGFTTEQMQEISKRVYEVVELERESLIGMLRKSDSPKEFVASMKDRQSFMEDFLLFQRARYIQDAVNEFISAAEATRIQLEDAFINIPSEAFRKRYRIDEQVAELRAKTKKDDCPKLLDRLGWALFLSGRHDELLALDDRRRSNRFKLAVAYAQVMRGEIEPAIKWSERAVRKSDADPFFLALAGGLYMLFASHAEGFIESTVWISKGLDMIEAAMAKPAQNAFDEMCVRFVQAKVFLTLPDPFGRTEEGRKMLERLLAQLRGKGRERFEPSFDGELEIFEVTINYFLAEAARVEDQDKKAAEYYRRVIELDPASEFGAKAFVHLGEIT